MSALAGFLSGMANGYGTMLTFQREAEANKDRQAERAYVQGQRTRQGLIQAREDRLMAEDDEVQAGLKAAAAPPKVETPGPSMDDLTGPGVPASGKIMPGENQTSGPRDAPAALGKAAEDTPGAQTSRMVKFLREKGRIEQAAKLEGVETQRQASALAVKAAEEKAKQTKFVQDAVNALGQGGWEGAGKFMTERYNDGLTYAFQPDGKGGATRVTLNAQGQPVGAPKAYRSAEDFLMHQMSALDPAKFVEYQTGRADKAEERAFKERQQTATELYQTGMVKAAQDKSTAALQKAGGGGGAKTGGSGSGGGGPSLSAPDGGDPLRGLSPQDREIVSGLLDGSIKSDDIPTKGGRRELLLVAARRAAAAAGGAIGGGASPGAEQADRLNLAANVGVPMPVKDPYAGLSVKSAETMRRKLYDDADKQLDKMDDQVQAAQNMARAAQRFVRLQDGVSMQGPLIGRLPAVSDAAQEMDAITAQIVPKMREPGSGATSDFDAKMFERATISRTKNNATNKAIAEGVQANAVNAADRQQFLRDYLTVHGHTDGAQAAWKRYLDKNPIFDPKSEDTPILNPARQPYADFFRNELKINPPRSAGRGGGQGSGAAAPPAASLSSEDQQALTWARANKSDPRATQILQRLGAN